MLRAASFGGGKRDRTADLLHAMQALSQLSYTPKRARIIVISFTLVKLISEIFLLLEIFTAFWKCIVCMQVEVLWSVAQQVMQEVVRICICCES